MKKMERFPEKNPNPVMSVKKDGMILYSNVAGEPLLQEWGVGVGEKIAPYIGDFVQKVISQNSPEKMEVKVGKRVYLVEFHPLPEEECVNLYGFDISDQKELEGKLRKSEEELREAQRIAHVGSWYWDAKTDANIVSDELLRIFGQACPPFKEQKGTMYPPESWERLNAAVQKTVQTGVGYELDLKALHGDGHAIWIMTRGEAVRDANGVIIGLHGTVQDITERKQVEETLQKTYKKLQAQSEELQAFNEELQAQSEEIHVQNEELQAQSEELQEANEALRESEGRFRTMANTIPQLAWIARPDGYIYWYNERWYAYTGTTPEQMEGWGWQSVHDPEMLLKVLEQWKASISTGQMFDMEFPLRGADGIFRPFITRVLPLKDEKGNILQWFGTNTDVTGRKRIEEELNQSVKQYRTLGDTIPYGVWLTDATGYCTYVSNSFLELVDMSMEQVQEFGWLHLLPPEDIQPTADHWLHCVQTGEDFEREHRFRTKDGSYRNVLAIGRPIKNEEGKITEWVGFNLDITERKQMEDAIKKARDSLEEKVKERTAELEEAYSLLKESEQGLAEAQRMAHIGSWNRDFVVNKLHWSDEIYRIFGLKPQEFEVNYGLFLNYVHPDDRGYVDNAITQALDGKPFDVDFRIILANGEERIVNEHGEVVFDENNIPVRIRGTTQDITERKRAEEALHKATEHERFLADVVENADIPFGVGAPDGMLLMFNRAFVNLIGYSREELIQKHWATDLTPPEWREYEIARLAEALRTHQPVRYEKEYLRKDGTRVPVELFVQPVFDTSGNLLHYRCFLTDVTERKKAEDILAKIEIARKQEIHHRIKNNLQVISSLLDLQSEMFRNRDDIKDSEVLRAFRESQDRVISMALIHEELHKGGEIDTLDFSSYMEELADNLLLTYRLGDTDISLNLDLEEKIFFDMDTAVPLGIIVNELVSNSLKHAFVGRDEGEIQIKIYREGIKNEDCKSTAFVLTISDNGVGIPELDIEDLDTLGMQLVTSLIDQLDGELKLKRNNGTEFIMRFTVTEKG